jgi:hypothetical protein
VANFNQEERWKPFVGHELKYEVSDFGRIRRIYIDGSTSIVSLRYFTNGYAHFRIVSGTKRKCHLVHRSVMAAFIGVPPEGYEVNHKDSNKANNRLDNLEYVTHRENIAHMIKSGRHRIVTVCGEKSPHSKLKASQVLEIIELVKNGIQKTEIAKKYGVTAPNIGSIAKGRTWKEVTSGKF